MRPSPSEWTEKKIQETLDLIEAALREQCPTCRRAPGHPCTPADGDGMLIHGARLAHGNRPLDRVLTWSRDTMDIDAAGQDSGESS